MKINFIIIVVCAILLTACSVKDSEMISLMENKNVEISNYEETKSVKNEIVIDFFEIDLPENSSVSTFCVYKDTLYYSVHYIDFFEDPIGNRSEIKFENQYNTQIRAYSLKHKKDELLFQYEEDRCIQVTDLQCNGKELVWEDYTGNNQWNIKKLSLRNKAQPENIYSYVSKSGEMWTVALTITENNLYWYFTMKNNDSAFILYSYDLDTKEVRIEQADLSLASIYEHVNIVHDVGVTFKALDDGKTMIHLMNLRNKKSEAFQVNCPVSNPVSNGEICVWSKGYEDRSVLFVYNIKDRSIEKIAASEIFSYGLIDDILLINQKDGIFCYDIKSKEYSILIDKEEGAYGFTFQGFKGNVYAEMFQDNHKLRVVNFRKQ